jgi:hypothetical protein
MFRELMAVMASHMMTSRSLICLLKNQNGGKLQKGTFCEAVFIFLYVLRWYCCNSTLAGVRHLLRAPVNNNLCHTKVPRLFHN